MTKLTRISTMPTSDDPIVHEFALLSSEPAAMISAALADTGGIPAWSTYMRIFVIEESETPDYSRQDPAPGDFMTIRARAESKLLRLSGTARTMALLNWLRQQVAAAGEAYDWPIEVVNAAFARVSESELIYEVRTVPKLNPQRTLRAQGTFRIDHEAVRHYSLTLEDTRGLVATTAHSERSFGDFDSFARDFRKGKWFSGLEFRIVLFGDQPLTVQAPPEWQSAGKLQPARRTKSLPRPLIELDRPGLAADDFWALIAELNGKADPAAMGRLEAQLASLTEEQIYAFSLYLADALAALDTDEYRNQPVRDLTDNSKDPDIGLSDDAFLYARCSAVTFGRAYWSDAVRDPANFAGTHDLGAERLLFVAPQAFERRTGRIWPWE